MESINYKDLALGQFPNYDSSAVGYRNPSDIHQPSVLQDIYSINPALALARNSIERQYGGVTPKKAPNERISQILANVESYEQKDPRTGRVLLNAQGYSTKGIRPPADVSQMDFLKGARSMVQEFPNARPFKSKSDITLSSVTGDLRQRFRDRLDDLQVNDYTTGRSLYGRVNEDTDLTGQAGFEKGKAKYIEGKEPISQFGYSEEIPGGYDTTNDVMDFIEEQGMRRGVSGNEVYLPSKVQKSGVKRTAFGQEFDSVDRNIREGKAEQFARAGIKPRVVSGGGLMNLPTELAQEKESILMGRRGGGSLVPHEAGFGKVNPANVRRGEDTYSTTDLTRPPKRTRSYNIEEQKDRGQSFTTRKGVIEISPDNLDIRGGGMPEPFYEEGVRNYPGDTAQMLPPPTGNPIARERPEVNLFDESDIGRGFNSRNSVTGQAYIEHPEALAHTRFRVDVPPERESNSVFAKVMGHVGGEPMLAQRSGPSGSRRNIDLPFKETYDTVEPDYSTSKQYLSNIGRGLGPDNAPTEEIADFLRSQGAENARDPEGKPTYRGTDTYTLGLDLAGKVHEGLGKVDADYNDIAATRRELNTTLAQAIGTAGNPKYEAIMKSASPAEITSYLAYDPQTGDLKPGLEKYGAQIEGLESRESRARDATVHYNRQQEVFKNFGFEPDTEGPPGTSGSSTYRNLDLDWQIEKANQDMEINKGAWDGTVPEREGGIPIRGYELGEWAANTPARSKYGAMDMGEPMVGEGRRVASAVEGQRNLDFQRLGSIEQDRPVVREPASAATQGFRYRMANPERVQRQLNPEMPAPKHYPSGEEFKRAQMESNLRKIALARR